MPVRLHIPVIQFAWCLLFLVPYLPAQTPEPTPYNHTVMGHFNFVSASRLFLDPFSGNPVRQNQSIELGSNLSYGIEYLYRLQPGVQLAAAAEYASNTTTSKDPFGTRIEDGFELILLEMSGLFTLPFSSEDIRFYLGGGIGGYLGWRNYTVGTTASHSVNYEPSVGIHVITGLAYYPISRLSIHVEFRFRDPQVTAYNEFDTDTEIINGRTYHFPTTPLPSRINLNGNVYSLGVGFHF
ncbi:MAG: hypothetical protein GXO82_01720 [Chlorobi bacterium]|nr:hypothetical protein [Chlorobiota bacterium]